MAVKTDRTSRTLHQLNPGLNKAIAAYATAASAVGVALLAATPPAEAKIVYTKTRQTFTGVTQPHPIDLNHDGVADFSVSYCSCRPHAPTAWTLTGPAGNSVRFGPAFPGSAGALPGGAPIGPKQAFIPVSSNNVFLALRGYYVGYYYSGGSWLGGKNAYLGLKFMIHGEVHFGWARLTVPKNLKSVILTGYAYETTPNKPLKAGQTSEAASDEVKSADTWLLPANGPSLGMLARGTEAMPVWRKEAWRREEEEKVA
ncbi:MAG: hypothetical protein ACRD3B_16960 [Candidatus Sulfotelmatobacter sp.]